MSGRMKAADQISEIDFNDICVEFMYAAARERFWVVGEAAPRLWEMYGRLLLIICPIQERVLKKVCFIHGKNVTTLSFFVKRKIKFRQTGPTV